jgi:cell division protein FtsW
MMALTRPPLPGLGKRLIEGLRQRLASLVRRRRSEPAAVPVRDWINVSAGQPTRLLGFDQTLLWVVVALLALGMVMVYSASVALPDNPKFARYTPTYFLTRHVASIAVAALAALVAVQIRWPVWEKWSPWLFVASLLLLVVVLVPHIGKVVYGRAAGSRSGS